MPKVTLYTARELAAYFEVALSTVYSWCAQGKIPFIKVGGKILFQVEEVEKILVRTFKELPNRPRT
jgi:excisionase family DNA binding protein